jgi:ABC-type phosphate transport system substrate-binding protein
MRRLQFFLIAAAVSIWSVVATSGASLKVVVNATVKSSTISADELKRIFLATKTSFNDGSHAEPVLEKGGPAHEAFLKEYIGKTDVALQTYYRSLVFTGKASMPKALATDAAVVAYIAKTKGAIGYVSAGCDTAGVKIIDVK